MKIKSVLAAFIAAAALSCTAVCAFADDATPTDDQTLVESEATDGDAATDTENESDGEDGDNEVANDEDAANNEAGNDENAANADEAANNEVTSDDNVVSSIPENVSEAADPMEGNPVSGVDGAAALAGIAMVAGALLVISHKHA